MELLFLDFTLKNIKSGKNKLKYNKKAIYREYIIIKQAVANMMCTILYIDIE